MIYGAKRADVYLIDYVYDGSASGVPDCTRLGRTEASEVLPCGSIIVGGVCGFFMGSWNKVWRGYDMLLLLMGIGT